MTNASVEVRWVKCDSGETCSSQQLEVSGALVQLGLPLASWIGKRRHIICRARLRDDQVVATGSRSLEAAGVPRDISSLAEAILDGDDVEQCRQVLRTQLAVVDIERNNVQTLGAPDLFRDVICSPDGQYILVKRFALDAGERGTSVADLPSLTDIRSGNNGEVLSTLSAPPNDAKQVRRIEWLWHPLEPATLVCVKHSDTHVTEITKRRAPFLNEQGIYTTDRQIADVSFSSEGALFVWERERHLEARDCVVLSPGPDGIDRESEVFVNTAWDLENRARSSWPVWNQRFDQRLVVQVNGEVYVRNERAVEGESCPCLEAVAYKSGTRTTRYVSEPNAYEEMLSVLDPVGPVILTRFESPSCPPQYRVVDVAGNRVVTIEWPEESVHAPSVVPIKQRLVYQRDDGISLSATAYLPRRDAQDLAFLVWVYPPFSERPQTAFRLGRNKYTRLELNSPLFLLEHGFGVVLASTPVIGSPHNRIESAVSQITASAKAIVHELVYRRLADPARIVVGGYCYGALAAVTLLQQTELFCAGIAESGAFNQTNHPHQICGHERSVSAVPQLFAELSPLLRVSRLMKPVLIIHGEREGPPADSAMESQNLFVAIAAAGGKARYVSLAREGHFYRGARSWATVADEILSWCTRFAGGSSNEQGVHKLESTSAG